MEIGAVILAGGKSRRMGVNKARLKIGESAFLDKIAGQLKSFDELLISVDDEKLHPDIQYTMVSDIYRGCGPLGGLHSALSQCRSEALLAVSCDMPLFSRAFAEYLAGALDADTDAVIPVTSDGLHPLCAVYRKSCAEVFKKYLEAGDLKIINAYADLKMKYLEITREDFQMILEKNINTPEDYAALCAGEERL